MRKLLNIILKNIGLELHKYVPVNSPIGHSIDTLAYSPDNVLPSDFIMDLMIKSINKAWTNEITFDFQDHLEDSVFFNIYPGEHYRLLTALMNELSPGIAIEIGTYTGMGSLSMVHGLPSSSKIITFDVVAWNEFPSYLNDDLFSSGKLTQHLVDLSDERNFMEFKGLLDSASFIFCDGPKDGRFEYQFISYLTKLKPKKGRVLMLDDIRFKNMIDLWFSIESPKLDMSSFGHWSGTGLVDMSDGLKLK